MVQVKVYGLKAHLVGRKRELSDAIHNAVVETPRPNWGIRGSPGDELDLTYRIDT